jgi:hypothetical protein
LPPNPPPSAGNGLVDGAAPSLAFDLCRQCAPDLFPIVTRRGPMMGFRRPPTARAECGSIAHEDAFDTSSSREGRHPHGGVVINFISCWPSFAAAQRGMRQVNTKTKQWTGPRSLGRRSSCRSPASAAAEGRFLGAETGARRRPLALNPRRPVLRCCRPFRCA